MEKGKIASFIITSILIFNYTINNLIVKAAPIDKSITKVNKQTTNVDKQISSLESQMEKTDNAIENAMINISNNTININKMNSCIKETSEEISARGEMLKYDELKNKFIVKTIYENGNSTTILLKTIFESKNFADFISKTTAVNKVLAANEEIIEKVHEDKKYIENKQKKLLSDRNNVEKLISENKYKLSKLSLDKSKQAEALSELNGLKISISNASSNMNIYNPEHLLYGDDNVVNYSKNFLGIPYLWGGTTPAGFDCSGFVQYIYAHFRINLPRTTYEQVDVGITVTGDLQPGDLIFFGETKTPHHVGMYIGENQYIQAPHTGDYIKISSINGCGYSIAKRIK